MLSQVPDVEQPISERAFRELPAEVRENLGAIYWGKGLEWDAWQKRFSRTSVFFANTAPPVDNSSPAVNNLKFSHRFMRLPWHGIDESVL